MRMTLRNLVMFGALAMLLSACGSGHRITYSGHEESTEGVPGYVNGKKVAPNVKLGQSYNIDGDTYVPRFQPDYVEEGMASWYGPGFHGGSTANGESFDTHSFTAAHRTLPLPSIVKVTMISTGKSIFVRINDRGPYAKGRIIDLSRAAAQELGMLGKGTAKVRVEYDLAASQRFADLLAQGRSPDSIDVAEEVLPYAHQQNAYAVNRITPPVTPVTPETPDQVMASNPYNPIPSAYAAEPVTYESNPNVIQKAELAPPATAQQVYAPPVQARGDPPINSPPARNVASYQSPAQPELRSYPPASQPPLASATGGVYVQLGTFSQQENALRMQQKVAGVGQAMIVPKPSGNMQLYRVRMGPYREEDAPSVIYRLQSIGIRDSALVRQ